MSHGGRWRIKGTVVPGSAGKIFRRFRENYAFWMLPSRVLDVMYLFTAAKVPL